MIKLEIAINRLIFKLENPSLVILNKIGHSDWKLIEDYFHDEIVDIIKILYPKKSGKINVDSNS